MTQIKDLLKLITDRDFVPKEAKTCFIGWRRKWTRVMFKCTTCWSQTMVSKKLSSV